MGIKKLLMSLTAAVTALTAGLQSTVFAYAAPISASYISDIKSIRCESADEAKKAFEAEGYTMLDTNVNPTLEKSVYIGYKTSSNINDAITGLKFMNMNGPYSFSQYEDVLKNYRAEVDTHIEGLIPAIEAFRANFKAGKDSAVQAYTMMNNIYDAINDSCMGDFLLNCSLKEKDREPLVNAMMKGNAGIVQAIERYLAMASVQKSGDWFNKLENTSLTKLVDSYMEDYPVISKAQRAMAQDYGIDAMTIKATHWDDLYNALQGVENTITKTDDDTYDIAPMLEELPENCLEDDAELSTEDTVATAELLLASEGMIAVYETLSKYEYDGESLLDFFNRPSDEVTLEEIYPLISVMTDAQRGTLSSAGLVNFLLYAEAPDDWNDEQQKLIQEYSAIMDDNGKVSLYYDVNLRAFDDGVAMTSAALQRDAANTSILNMIRSDDNSTSGGEWFCVGLLTLMATAAGTAGVVHHIKSIIVCNGMTIKGDKAASTALVDTLIQKDDFNLAKEAPKIDTLNESKNLQEEAMFLYNELRSMMCVCYILCLIFTTLSVIAAFGCLWKSIDYTEIPALICDAEESENFSDYVFYDAVQGLNQEDAPYADMNGYDQSYHFLHGSLGWLVLYYTKDKRVGSPLTELKFQTGNSKAPLGYEGAAIFGEGAATNLTSKEFTGQTEDPQIYLFYKRAANSLTGTVRTNGGYILTGTLSLLAGGLIGGLIASKRKKKSAEAPAAA